ncbi:MAG: hypothetical protein OEV01_11845 [Nitrospira sp.]|nr:hypothetical protein [Nitrospira sp.]MDH5193301.1 hypothetical protein [Nitrospira sp.]
MIHQKCSSALGHLSYRHGTLAQAIEWETVKLQSRLQTDLTTTFPSIFRDQHVHIGALIQCWRRLACDVEESLASRGIETLLDIGPWGGFNFVLQTDGYTRMKFARLTLGIGSIPSLPLEEQGGPFFDEFLPRYRATLADTGVVTANKWGFHHPKHDACGSLVELSSIYYLPGHTYERRTFVKVRVSREFETVEEIILRDFIVLLERLHHTCDWDQYRSTTQHVDARFDLQDFISLNHVVEQLYQRTEEEEALLREIKDAFTGAIREPAVLYSYWNRVVKSKWIEHLYWAIAEAGLGVRKYQRPVMLGYELFPKIPPRLLLPVRRHLQAYHREMGARRPA